MQRYDGWGANTETTARDGSAVQPRRVCTPFRVAARALYLRATAVVYWMKCRSCGELVDEFQLDRWPGEAQRELSICLLCEPAVERDDDDE